MLGGLPGTGQRLLEAAHRFFIRGHFAAAMEILPDLRGPFANLWPKDVLDMAAFVQPMAAFYAAWDRLDYKSAAKMEIQPAAPRPSDPTPAACHVSMH